MIASLLVAGPSVPASLPRTQVSQRLRISSDKTMELAETLYQRGYLSYPRTETDKFKEGTDLNGLIRAQLADGRWSGFAQVPRSRILP